MSQNKALSQIVRVVSNGPTERRGSLTGVNEQRVYGPRFFALLRIVLAFVRRQDRILLRKIRSVAQFGLAHLNGVQGVSGSNPLAPTKNLRSKFLEDSSLRLSFSAS